MGSGHWAKSSRDLLNFHLRSCPSGRNFARADSQGEAMPYWNEFKSDVETPKNRRLLLITQPSGTPDDQEMDIHDVVVGHWSSPVWGFVIANVPNETASGAKLKFAIGPSCRHCRR
jgi:hypothetical protein